jgi:GGDEF domain-containing protein
VDRNRTPLRGLSYARAQQLLVIAGVGVLGALALVMYVRRVETVEVLAVLLFVPVFLALLRWNQAGGIAAAAVASIAYVALRASAIDAVGASRFTGLIVARAMGFFVFGFLGGWANSYLRASLTKLDLYDQVDDETGLFNARYFVQGTDLEIARARRYRSIFAVSMLEIPVAPLDRLGRRPRAKLMRELGRILHESVRQVDRVVHTREATRHRVAAILPETGPEGADVFTGRLVARVAEFLADRGVQLDDGALRALTLTYPDDEVALETLRREFASIDQVEHPEASAAGSGNEASAPVSAR